MLLADPFQLITTAEAADHCGVDPSTIRQWCRRGLLTRANPGERGEAKYSLVDVARAEQATRHRARRTPHPKTPGTAAVTNPPPNDSS
ncbi:Helix-turn-helix domain protein [Streptomonospora litoralis]|uniref:Helix-turn-helix domain protein n=2 Tax=Streptomonospora litoralis TaxID=2498135 RepID=A0A4P6Q3P9_9ACTN|nr:helix-turn-helix domain-containing protein [Streptomonospora litoralis]QBI53444.1 Helix-turn-helix domain protein [Streptomonospora litoralis]